MVSAVQAIATNLGTPFPPVNDGSTQLQTPLIDNNLVYFNAPQRAHIPLLIGSNLKEAGLVQIIQQEQGQTLWSDSFATYATEALYICVSAAPFLQSPARNTLTKTNNSQVSERVAKAQVQLNNDLTTKPVWRYNYNGIFDDIVRFIDPPGVSPPLTNDKVGSYHTAEIPLVFGTYPGTNSTLAALSIYMQKVWGNFAKTPSAAPASGFYQQTATSNNPVATQMVNCLGCAGNPTGLSAIDEKTLDGDCPVNINNGYNSPAPDA